jgi:hypothetical protein
MHEGEKFGETTIDRDGRKYLLTPFRWTLLMAVAFFLAAGRSGIFRAWLAFGIHSICPMTVFAAKSHCEGRLNLQQAVKR